jgi:hypothetical protein
MAQQKEAQQMQMLRNQQIAQQGQQFGVFAPLYQAGLKFGDVGAQAAMQGLFPQQADPRLQQATAIQSVLAKYQGEDLSDPAVLSKIRQDLVSVAPEAALRLDKELKALTKETKPVTISPGQSIVNPNTGEVLYTAPDRTKTENKVLPPGAVLVDSEGNIIAEGKPTQTASEKVSPEWTRYQELLKLGTPEQEARAIAYKTNTLDFRKDLEESRKTERIERQNQQRDTTILTIDNVMTTVDKALSQVGTFTSGAVGTPLSFIPGTSAKNLEANLSTIKANLGFDRLQQMRDASPTGGALGQVAIQELVALQASIASLDIQQSPAQLKQNLNKIQEHYKKWRNAVNKAKGSPTIGSSMQAPVGVDPAVWNVMTPEEKSLWQK